jgi:hypothetical protein
MFPKGKIESLAEYSKGDKNTLSGKKIIQKQRFFYVYVSWQIFFIKISPSGARKKFLWPCRKEHVSHCGALLFSVNTA